MLPVRDDDHQQLSDYSNTVASICLSETFLSLKKELERHYRGSDPEDMTFSRLAFQDALYTLMAEEELDFGKPLAVVGKG